MAVIISILFFISLFFFITVLTKGLKRLYNEGKDNTYYASGSYIKYSVFFIFLCAVLYITSLQFSSRYDISKNNSINALYYNLGSDGTLYAESTHYNSTVYWISLTNPRNVRGYSVFYNKGDVYVSLLKPQDHLEYYRLAIKCITKSKNINTPYCKEFNNYQQIGFGKNGVLSGLNFKPKKLRLTNLKLNYLNFHPENV